MEGIEEGKGKKRGRKPKNDKRVYIVNRDQTKFFVDLSNDKKELELIFKYLKEANLKDYGREIIFRDLALAGLRKLTNKDIEILKSSSLSEMEKVQESLNEFNKKTGQNFGLGEYLVKKLNIN
jgi:hypothetical protein